MDAQKTPDGAEKLTGSVEGVIYANEQNGYTILDFGTDGHELVTLVGIMPYVAEGDELTVYGKWVHNPKYGRQFAVEQFEKRLPSDSAAILRYLSSGAVRNREKSRSGLQKRPKGCILLNRSRPGDRLPCAGPPGDAARRKRRAAGRPPEFCFESPERRCSTERKSWS